MAYVFVGGDVFGRFDIHYHCEIRFPDRAYIPRIKLN